MSRALDKGTAAALQSGNPEAAFRAIADVLTEQGDTAAAAGAAPPRLEIEFLGREHPPLASGSYVLRDGPAVAVPKLALVQAFLVARKVLQRHRSSFVRDGVQDHQYEYGKDEDEDDKLLRATAVMLLMDPEHLTAANTRKRIILARNQNALDAAVSRALLRSELHLVDSLLTSYLHRHTKSPTLWNHRRWLLSTLCAGSDGGDDDGDDADASLLRDMADVIMVAAVRHPHNYYAWDHARWLVRQNRMKTSGEGDGEAAKKLVVLVRDWCYRHHTDTSGWSFLLFLLTATPRPLSAPSTLTLYNETVDQVERMSTTLRWTGEAVWVFLRTATADLCGREEACEDKEGTYERFRARASALQSRAGDAASLEHKILQQAQDWCATYAQ